MEQLASFVGNCPSFRHLLYELTLSRIFLNNSFKPYGALLVTLHSALHRFYVSRKGRTGGSGWGYRSVLCMW